MFALVLPETFVTSLGLIAGTLTTIAFLPQLIKIWRSRSAKDISLGMFLIFSTGVFLWLVYGLLIGDTPIVVANFITFVLAVTILVFKFRYS
jgi:MtN3 and saliva related transmembrane protein